MFVSGRVAISFGVAIDIFTRRLALIATVAVSMVDLGGQ